MASAVLPDKLPGVLRDAILGMVRREGPDLSARQLVVFLICYLEDGPHTVRGLAARLDVSKPAITRSLDRLTDLGFAKRAADPADRRSVLVTRTRKGEALLAELKRLLTLAATASNKPAKKPARGK
jgi:DNA-binding MarR family transcriptional regulator